jgi:CHRD domain-containing protein
MRALFVAAALTVAAWTALAQTPASYKARLSPVPIDVTMQATIAGTGAVTATLSGSRLAVTGTFDGLRSPATTAAVHRSPVRGVRGPDVGTLTVSHGTSGTVSGSLELTAQQTADLQAGRLYVQIASEKAPDGNLWGWLLEKR